MKTVLSLLTGLCLLALSGQAQDDRKLRNDPTYSTHNYKHPNKAAAARRWEASEGVSVRQPAPGDARLADYKKQVPFQQPSGGVTVDHTPVQDVTVRNYKIQRPFQAASPDTITRKKTIRPDKSTGIGD
ncbi:hypothetical protein HNV11_12265 [Spirosoma taeanense]|uniref:Uncharacterized protein n=1 Tax=Spirosoma taeanense TaxID=2735870 RepID=A0A6M5YA53_9BACT|nr:hypothetical protein [Spirosoma taeanense]QJW90093.1 hypothetical protein HNV11_12265 [Spirosoma taeanense]